MMAIENETLPPPATLTPEQEEKLLEILIEIKAQAFLS